MAGVVVDLGAAGTEPEVLVVGAEDAGGGVALGVAGGAGTEPDTEGVGAEEFCG